MYLYALFFVLYYVYMAKNKYKTRVIVAVCDICNEGKEEKINTNNSNSE